MNPISVLLTLCVATSGIAQQTLKDGAARAFDPAKDLISLHYDHADDKDDGQSAAAWKAAFAYYNPKDRLDFSDTGELMHILGLGELGFDEFRKRYLEHEGARTPEPLQLTRRTSIASL